jgi:predicted nucleotidyltransferase
MDRDAVLQKIREQTRDFARRGVRSLTLFGPLARQELKPRGEINFIIDMAPPHTLAHFLEVKDYLTTLLNYPQVELVMVDPRQPDIWPLISPDVIEIRFD